MLKLICYYFDNLWKEDLKIKLFKIVINKQEFVLMVLFCYIWNYIYYKYMVMLIKEFDRLV